ncbi:MAG: arginase [Planctomycetes bacterium]|nr:arginase [Planctomycetota bacterium]
MKNLPRRPVSIIGVPMDLGAGRRGTDMGPSAVRLAGLHKQLARAGFDDVEDLGDLDVPAVETLTVRDEKAKHVDEIATSCRALAKRVRSVLNRGRVPVVLGGDHSLAVGSISGVAAHFRKRKQSIGLLWVDAHGDINTPATTRSGNVHGMPLAALVGLPPEQLARIEGAFRKVDPDRVALVGIRDLDPGERDTLREVGAHVFTMTDIDERGIAAVMRDAVRIVSGPEAGPFHVSFDVDGIDPDYAPGVGTAVEGGLTYREAHFAMELVAETGRMSSMDVVELNPVLDEHNRTGKLAMELILSAMGKRIYLA